MNQTDMIQRIIATEQQAQALTEAAKQEQADLEKNIDAEIAEMRQRYETNAEQFLQDLEQKEHEKSASELEARDKRLKAKLNQVESIYNSQRDAWIDAIFERIVGKAGG